MSLDRFLDRNAVNKYCKLRNLENESAVEQNLLIPFLDELGFTEDYREPKKTIEEYSLGKGKKKKKYAPDFICYLDISHKKPVLIIDAKSPTVDVLEGVSDSQSYTAVLRRKLKPPKLTQYCLGCNGIQTVVKQYEDDNELFRLDFEDLVDGNPKFSLFIQQLSRENLAKNQTIDDATFKFDIPSPNEIKGIFEACHQIIWAREFESPVPAFWEFCKLMFVKLNEDKNLRKDPEIAELIKSGNKIPANKVIFSSDYIESHKGGGDKNPIKSLFRTFRDDFETEVLAGHKKRIFDEDEELDLEPETIRQVVELLEHYDLIRIDEDLNGRLFQTFLSATMRGRELGQFFTPRSVVEFMTDLAELRVSSKPPYSPLVADLCCGTGGFLIEAMAHLTSEVKTSRALSSLSEKEKEKIEKLIKDERLFGIDAGKNPPVARIARMNMYLHGDGGSRIFFADSLDKKIRVASTTHPEIRKERAELGKILNEENIKFDVCLTNPPFSMTKKSVETDQKLVISDYDIRKYTDKNGKNKVKKTLRSNVMFLERYHDLLRDEGTLITVIDESVLNTDSSMSYRKWLLRNYYIKAVISLPRWSFFEAGANVKTSILLMTKKGTETYDQGETFFARSENIGYDGSRLDETKSDLHRIRDAYFEYLRNGTYPIEKGLWNKKSHFYSAKISENTRRIDFEWLDPRHSELDKELISLSKKHKYSLKSIGDLIDSGVCKLIQGKTAKLYLSEGGIPMLKVRNVSNDGVNWDTDNVLRTFYDSNPKSHLLKDDVLITSTGDGTIGRVCIYPDSRESMTDGHVTTIRILDKSKLLPDYLVHYLRSDFGQVQFERYTVGCTGQTELNDSDIKKIKILYPESTQEQGRILNEALRLEKEAISSKQEYLKKSIDAKTEFINALRVSSK